MRTMVVMMMMIGNSGKIDFTRWMNPSIVMMILVMMMMMVVMRTPFQ